MGRTLNSIERRLSKYIPTNLLITKNFLLSSCCLNIIYGIIGSFASVDNDDLCLTLHLEYEIR